MHTALTIQERLKDLRAERGLTLEQLAEQTGISSSALGSYENDEGKNISNYSIVKLAKFYEISTDYLLGLTETKNHPNADLNDLHLSDNMINLLRSGQINNRLLCEMASHKDFMKLMADIEIYIDGIAAMQVQNLNAYVTLARNAIEKKYAPGDNDHHIQILNAAHINEDNYFCNIVHADIDGIIREIKGNHRSDSESAPETDFVQELNSDLGVRLQH